MQTEDVKKYAVAFVLHIVFWLWRFMPLAIFFGYAAQLPSPGAEHWLTAFKLGGAAGIFQICIFLIRKATIPRLILGVDAYLIAGGLASVFDCKPALLWLNEARETGLFISLLCIGIITTLCSCGGYIGAEKNFIGARRASLLFLLATVLALMMSIFFKGNIMLSAAFPLVALVVINKRLKNHLDLTALDKGGLL